jgi:hypothetical protein
MALVCAVCVSVGFADADNDMGEAVKLPPKIQASIASNAALKEYIPIAYATGELNLDGIDDAIVVLAKKGEPSYLNSDVPPSADLDDTEIFPLRKLVILLGSKDKSYKIIKIHNTAVYRAVDGGAKSGDDLFRRVVVKNGYFTIEHAQSGFDAWEQYDTFKYDKVKKEWFLHKNTTIGYKENDKDDGEAIVVDYNITKSTKDFGVLLFDDWSIH